MPTSHPSRSSSWVHSLLGFIGETLCDAISSVRQWSIRQWLLSIAIVATVLIFMFAVELPELATLRTEAREHGAWSLPIVWVAYVIFTLFPIPRTIWTVASGILFGPAVGMLVALSALTVSATLAFSAVRSALGEWMRPRLSHPAVSGLNEHLSKRGWLAIASLRMIAAVPFSALNYAAGLTSIPLGQFAFATLIGSIPTTALGVFFGDALVYGSNPWIVAAMILFALIGFAALYGDYRNAHANNTRKVKPVQ